MDDRMLIAPETLLADVYAGRSGVYHGRVTKKYDHKKVCLLQLLCCGQRLKAVIRKGTTANYELIRDAVSLGSAVCGIGRLTLDPKNETEIEFAELYLVREDLHKGNGSGLVSGSKFTKNDMKRYFHTYLCDSELCAMNIAARGAVFSGLRHGLEERGYIECTTPMLTRNFYGGGAQPFITHMLDNGADMYLRVSAEIAMKNIIGGGFDRVYEIGPSFRNGSVSAKYATPFYGAEIYTAYCTEQDNIDTAIALMRCIEISLDRELEKFGAEKKISFLGDIPSVSFGEYYLRKTGECFDPRLLAVDCEDRSQNSREIYKQLKSELIADQISPILITDLPAGSSPLIAEKSESTLRRSYLVANGATISECAIGSSDPRELCRQFGLQDGEQNERYKRDHEPFLHLYESGMPPVGSIFIGVDRIVPAFLGIDNINDYLMSM